MRAIESSGMLKDAASEDKKRNKAKNFDVGLYSLIKNNNIVQINGIESSIKSNELIKSLLSKQRK